MGMYGLAPSAKNLLVEALVAEPNTARVDKLVTKNLALELDLRSGLCSPTKELMSIVDVKRRDGSKMSATT